MAANEILTPEEVDRLFRYPRGRAAKLARAKKLPVIFLPDGEVRFRQSDIAELLNLRECGGADHAD